jgi:hypothetical protein
MALHKPIQLYVLGKLRFSSIKPMKMIEIWLKITFIFINGHDFQSGIKSICDECNNNGLKPESRFSENRYHMIVLRVKYWFRSLRKKTKNEHMHTQNNTCAILLDAKTCAMS